MGDFLRKNLLLISVFITGTCVLIVEISAVRVLSPYYGNTIFTVSSVISVILTALSAGYYIGGRLADRYPSTRLFFGIILVSGIIVLMLHFLGMMILPVLSISLSLVSGPLISSLILFLVPAFLLGTLSPYAIKLQSISTPGQGVGSVSGKIFFWSTLGSIIGSLSAGFVLIPSFGIDRIFIGTGAVLFLLGFIPLVASGFDKKFLAQILVAAAILVSLSSLAINRVKGDAFYSEDGVYEKIVVYDRAYEGRPARFFRQDRSAAGAVFLDTADMTDLVYDYTKYYSLYRIFKPDVKNALVIGGGVYSVPKALLAELKDVKVDVSEIEPSLFGLAKKYFGVKDDPDLHNYTEDGRRLLRDSEKRYDLIFSDVYSSLSVPAHFTTREFFTVAREKLSADGVLIVNLIGDLSRKPPSLIFSEIRTFREVFPNSYFFAVKDPARTDLQNIILAGYNGDKRIDLNGAAVSRDPSALIRALPDKAINMDGFDLSPYPVLTDNYSPVEYMTAEILKRIPR